MPHDVQPWVHLSLRMWLRSACGFCSLYGQRLIGVVLERSLVETPGFAFECEAF
jgi:hypothetical protein